MPLELNGTTGVQGNSGAFVAGTSVASTSGTSIDFTSIPSWVKRVTVMLNGVSTNGTGYIRFQLGTSSGVTTSGYVGNCTQIGTSMAAATSTSGFDSYGDNGASYIRYGVVVFNLLSSNVWTILGGYNLGTLNFQYIFTGTVPLSATLDRVRITTSNGTDTFDAGTINILWE
jgi:hypothetical protein